MVIKKTIAIKGDIEIVNAYLKVTSISGNKDKITYQIKAFKNKEQSDQENTISGYSLVGRFVPVVGDLNFIAQAYADAKQKEELIGGIDC